MNSTPPQGDTRSDADLISAVRSGDPSAYGVLFFRHSAAVTAMARYYARDNFTADDLVSEAFERTLSVISAGGGPDVSFRAYIYTAVRRLAYEQTEKSRKTRVTDDFTDFEMPDEDIDPAVSSFERTLVTGAFAGLPERWQAVLWYIEVEGMSPPEVAPLLGLTANGVSALAYRAREGLRQAYLQAHVIAEPAKVSCEEFRGKLGAYARGGLAKRDEAKVQAHLETCDECSAIVAELRDVGHGMRVIVAPLVLGGAAAAGLGFGGGATGASVAAVIALAPKGVWTAGKVLAIAGAVAAVAIIATLFVAAPSSEQALQASPVAGPVLEAPTETPEPTPTATSTPTPKPSTPPSAPPTPTPRSTTPPAAPAPITPPPTVEPDLAVAIAEVGDLVLGRDGMVGLTLTNSGKAPAKSVSFSVSLPPGVTIDPSRAMTFTGVSSWNCVPAGTSLTCSAPTLVSGDTVSLYLPVTVSELASGSTSVSVSSAGEPTRVVQAAHPVVADGLGTRYIANGRYGSTTSGASFVTCDTAQPECLLARDRDASVLLDNNDWPMFAIDGAGTGAVSSTTQLALPAGARVSFAGVYWSALTPIGDSDATVGQLALGAPDGSTHAVTASRVDHGPADLGDSYQAFADVTDLVAAGGAGAWTASGARVGPAAAASPGSALGAGVYAGWSLVVVYEDSALSEGRVTVFDGFEMVNDSPVSFTVSGIADSAATVGMVSWEGDAGSTGDSISLDGTILTRVTGAGHSDNACDATADGSAVPNSFGVDVGAFTPAPLKHARAVLTAASLGDFYTVGAVTVTAR